jgi:endonuclease/exonuclease/phosphatase family metal-dependent hydrolase
VTPSISNKTDPQLKSALKLVSRRRFLVASALGGMGLVFPILSNAVHAPARYGVKIKHGAHSSGFHAPSESIELKVCTYNVMGPTPWSDADRFRAISKELVRESPDLIGLQEMHFGPARQALPTSSDFSIIEPGLNRIRNVDWPCTKNGLYAVSRFPVLGGGCFTFSQRGREDRVISKGAMFTTIQLPNATLRFWTCHLQCGGPEFDEHRSTAIKEIHAWSEEMQRKSPVDIEVFAGDFNILPGTKNYERCSSLLGGNAVELAKLSGHFHTDDGTANTLSAQNPPESPDHIFILNRKNGALEVKVVNVSLVFTERLFQGGSLSDHFGLQAQLRITSKSE